MKIQFKHPTDPPVPFYFTSHQKQNFYFYPYVNNLIEFSYEHGQFSKKKLFQTIVKANTIEIVDVSYLDIDKAGIDASFYFTKDFITITADYLFVINTIKKLLDTPLTLL